jgi:hypothetical protein
MIGSRWLVIVLVLAAAGITAAAWSTSGLARPDGAPPGARSGAPSIVAGSPIGHPDRGACTGCHRIVSWEGERLPAISALSSLPHEFRGVCSNCHSLRASWLLSVLPAFALPNPAGPNTGLGSLATRALLALGSESE